MWVNDFEMIYHEGYEVTWWVNDYEMIYHKGYEETWWVNDFEKILCVKGYEDCEETW